MEARPCTQGLRSDRIDMTKLLTQNKLNKFPLAKGGF